MENLVAITNVVTPLGFSRFSARSYVSDGPPIDIPVALCALFEFLQPEDYLFALDGLPMTDIAPPLSFSQPGGCSYTFDGPPIGKIVPLSLHVFFQPSALGVLIIVRSSFMLEHIPEVFVLRQFAEIHSVQRLETYKALTYQLVDWATFYSSSHPPGVALDVSMTGRPYDVRSLEGSMALKCLHSDGATPRGSSRGLDVTLVPDRPAFMSIDSRLIEQFAVVPKFVLFADMPDALTLESNTNVTLNRFAHGQLVNDLMLEDLPPEPENLLRFYTRSVQNVTLLDSVMLNNTTKPEDSSSLTQQPMNLIKFTLKSSSLKL